jgi:SAM-dependent methyltransferase
MAEPPHLSTVRAAYDAMADVYAALFSEGTTGQPVDHALLTAFAELVRVPGPVADLGCGPGHATAWLDAHGLTAFGVDLSPAMVTLARQAYPSLRFEVGSMDALDLPDDALAGALVWYSFIHTPPEELPKTFAELYRVTAPGGQLLLGFFASNDDAVRTFDHRVSMAYRWPLDQLADLLRKAGFAELARLTREPEESERFLHGRLLFHKQPTDDQG